MLRLALFIIAVAAYAQQQPKDEDPWSPLRFLIGEWLGEGGGGPGQGTGGFSFQPDLDGKILVRKNHSEYPATKDRPAYSHDDLMLVYPEGAGAPLHAVYFDTEGHVIYYGIEGSADRSSVRFLSDAAPASARFRLTYRQAASGTVALKFEIAPPGKPDSFSTYIEATARRKPAK